jgi:signal transduction histidine kinase
MWVYFIVSTAMTFFEYPNIQAHRDWYLLSKILLQLWLLGLCWWIHRDPLGVKANLWVGIHVIVSNIHGQYFSPWYVFSFVEMIIAYAFLFPLPKKHFNLLLTAGTALYLAAALYRYDDVMTWFYRSQPSDLVAVILTASLVAMLAHGFFTSDRNQREELIRKFGLIGLQTANVVHDVKSLLSTPSLNLSLLQRHLENSKEHQNLLPLVAEIDRQLININQAMTGLNEVVSLQDRHHENFHLRAAIYEVSQTLSLALRQVHLEVDGDLEIHSEKALVKSVLFNLLMNSVQNFRRRKVIQPKIFVKCGPDWVSIEDNGGGFSDEVLKSLTTNSFDAFDGTGMGLFLVWSGIQNIGGKVTFSNSVLGARVHLHLPILGTSLPERFLAAKNAFLGR